jgi:hypothetical protein
MFYAEQRTMDGNYVPVKLDKRPSEGANKTAGGTTRYYRNIKDVPEEMKNFTLTELQAFFNRVSQ